MLEAQSVSLGINDNKLNKSNEHLDVIFVGNIILEAYQFLIFFWFRFYY
jgi:hypothetical protein